MEKYITRSIKVYPVKFYAIDEKDEAKMMNTSTIYLPFSPSNLSLKNMCSKGEVAIVGNPIVRMYRMSVTDFMAAAEEIVEEEKTTVEKEEV